MSSRLYIPNYQKLIFKTCSVKGVEFVCVWGDNIGGDYNWIWEPFDDTNLGSVDGYPKYEIKLKRESVEWAVMADNTKREYGYPILIRKVVSDGVYGEWDTFRVQKDELDTLTKTVSYSQFLIEWCSEIVDGLTDEVY